jgi:hypothetical protein
MPMPKVDTSDAWWRTFDLSRIQAEREAEDLDPATTDDYWRERWVSCRAAHIMLSDEHEALKKEVRAVRAFFAGGQ